MICQGKKGLKTLKRIEKEKYSLRKITLVTFPVFAGWSPAGESYLIIILTLLNAGYFYNYLTRGGGAIIPHLKSTQKSGFKDKSWLDPKI